MNDRLLQLEKIARQLEPSSENRKLVRDKVTSYTETFLDQIDSMKAFVTGDSKGEGILNTFSETPGDITKALELLEENVDNLGLNPASGGHLGYVPGGGIYYSALGDYLADITNRYAGTFFASPGGVRMENMLLQWLGGIAGYPKTAAGNLTSGGSIANLSAIVTARTAFGIKAKDFDRTVLYLSEEVHHCVDKALRIAGLTECIKRYIPLDKNFRMISEEVDKAIVKDKQAGLLPWMVIASAGTTNTGSVDPLDTIGDIAHKHKVWYHIDGAYGALFALCDEGKKILKGMEKSDSIVMDPHKTLFLPYGIGAVLIKDPEKLFQAHYYQANYMQDTLKAREELSPCDLSAELTKHFRGPRLWLPLVLHGIAPFRAAVEEKLLLARYFYEEIQKIKGFETGAVPELSVVLFRYVPSTGDADKFNEELVNEIHKDGRIFFSSTRVNGKFSLRICVLSFRTHKNTIDLTLQILKEKAAYLEARWK